jgi:acyl-coenzyme A thioesterase PaaI-like protein
VGEQNTQTFCRTRQEFLTTRGQLDFSVLAVLCDMALAASARPRVGAATRLATLSLTIYLHGAMGRDDLTAHSRLLSHDTSRHIVTASARVECGASLQATAIGSFPAMQNTQTLAPMPLEARARTKGHQLCEDIQLSPEEETLMCHALAARNAGVPGFLERFWGCRFSNTDTESTATFQTGKHAGNRVGHVQGGLLAALVTAASQSAVGDEFLPAAVPRQLQSSRTELAPPGWRTPRSSGD